MSIPNLITIGRIILVPIVVWAISSGAMGLAFGLFLAAGVSDAVDGFLAKRFNIDPALVSAPLISTLVDATGLCIFYTVAILLLLKFRL